MDKNNTRALISFSLALAVIFAATAVYYAFRTEKYQRSITAAGESALSQLIYSAETMESQLTLLSKSDSGAAFSSATSQLWSASQSALAALSALEVSGSGMPNCEKLLNQTGEYCLNLMQKASEGRQIAQEDTEALKSVAEDLKQLCITLREVKENLDTGEMALSTDGQAGRKVSLISEVLSKAESDYVPSYSLVYDGGYSDHISSVTPLHTQGMEDIESEVAVKTAAKFMKTASADIKLLYQTDGTIPVYGLDCGGKIVEVTKSGGMIVTVSAGRNVRANIVSKEDARDIALQACEELGYTGLACRYTSESANVLTVELVGSSGDVTVYPDRVTVRVALDNGEIIGFDGQKYLMSHTQRQLTLPENIPEGASLALLPTDGMSERLCYEYTEDGHLRFVCCETDTCYAIHPFGEGEQQGLID